MAEKYTYKMNPELKNAWDKVLFWAERLSRNSADKHPEWRVNYENAVKERDEIRERLHANK